MFLLDVFFSIHVNVKLIKVECNCVIAVYHVVLTSESVSLLTA